MPTPDRSDPPAPPRRAPRRPAAAAGHPYARFLTFVTLVLVGFLLWAAEEVLVPLALAALLTFLLTPLVRRLERLHLGRTASTLLAVLLTVCVLGGIGWALESQFVDVVNRLPDYQEQIKEKVNRFRTSGGAIGKLSQNIQATVRAVSPPAAAPSGGGPAASQPAAEPATPPAAPPAATPPPAPSPAAVTATAAAAGTTTNPGAPGLPNVTPLNPLPVREFPDSPSLASRVVGYLTKTLNPIATAFIVMVFVIFMLLAREDLRDRVVRLAGTGQLDLTTRALDDAAGRVSRYLLAQLMVNTIYAALVAAGLWAIGHLLGGSTGAFPSVLLLGLLCGVFRFVPYVGPFLGAALPVAVAFGFFPSNAVVAATVGLFVVLEVAVSQVAEPLLYGGSTGMSPLAVLVAAAFWTWLWGPVGLLLSTPVTVVLVVLGRHVPALGFLHVLLGDEPALLPHARVYQRLIALDREGADDVAAEQLKANGLAATYDDALLPALAMAERHHRRGALNRRRYRFVRGAILELVGDLSVQQDAADREAAEKAAAAVAAGGAAPPGPAAGGPAVEPGSTGPDPAAATAGPIVCVPATGGSDAVAAAMLARLLARRGYAASVGPRPGETDTGTAPAVAARAAESAAAVVCVSALPPAAAARARRACARLTAAAVPPGRLVIGLWANEELPETSRRRVACDPDVPVVTTLAAAVAAVAERAASTERLPAGPAAR